METYYMRKGEKMRGELETGKVFDYMLAGNSTFTILNTETKNRVTFKVTDVKRVDPEAKNDLWFVKVLTGSDNETAYSFLGTIQVKGKWKVYKHSKKSSISEDAKSAKVIDWIVRHTQMNAVPEKVKFFHEGKCGRCGRKLTVPESVTSGYGPECIKLMGC